MAPVRLAAASRPRASGRWLSAFGDRDEHYGVALIDAHGAARTRVPLRVRAHAAAVAPDHRTCVAVARRPGTLAALFDLDGRLRGSFRADPGRHFEGHGVFSRDGSLFYTSENDYGGERGIVGVRSVADGFRRIAEWPTAGIGPHELALGADGSTLVVANGGILTHPDTGLARLNVDSMSPSLVRLAADSGRVLEHSALEPGLSLLSIRHLAVTPGDDVVFGVQDEGLADPGAPLVGVWRRSGRIELVAHGATSTHRYIGGVSLDRSGGVAAASAPRDGWVGFFEVAGGRWLGEVAADDACGVAPCPLPGAFLVSTGQGALLEAHRVADRIGSRALATAGLAWDNHLAYLDGDPAATAFASGAAPRGEAPR
jgi:hypothetical protein